MSQKDNWPLVDMSRVTNTRWSEVMDLTASYNSLFDSELPDAEDFSIRAMVSLMLTADVSHIEYVMDGSMHLDRIKAIRKLFLEGDADEAVIAMKEFVDEFNEDMKG